MPVKSYTTADEIASDLCAVEDVDCKAEVISIAKEPVQEQEAAVPISPSTAADEYYTRQDPMFQYIKSKDIKEIYKKI